MKVSTQMFPNRSGSDPFHPCLWSTAAEITPSCFFFFFFLQPPPPAMIRSSLTHIYKLLQMTVVQMIVFIRWLQWRTTAGQPHPSGPLLETQPKTEPQALTAITVTVGFSTPPPSDLCSDLGKQKPQVETAPLVFPVTDPRQKVAQSSEMLVKKQQQHMR